MSMMLGNDEWLERPDDDGPFWGWGRARDEEPDEEDGPLGSMGIGIGHRDWIKEN